MDSQKIIHLLVGEVSWVQLLKSAVTVYLCLSVFGYFYSERAIFLPGPASYKDSEEIVKIDVGDGELISGVFIGDPNSEFVLLYSHGNAEDIGHVRGILEDLAARGFGVFAYDYRGYGTSGGKASEKNVYRDAEAAYDYLVGKMGIPAGRIILMGRSVGGAVAIELARRREVGGVILESAFTSAIRVITKLPIFFWDRFVNIRKIGKVGCPVLVIHGQADEIVNISHGRRLFAKAKEPKECLWVAGAGHNDVMSEVAGEEYWDAIARFIAIVKER